MDKRREISEEELRELARRYLEIRDERRALEKAHIILDIDAPICVNCGICIHQGFLFICPLYRYPEDGKIVGWYGIVYYRRRRREGEGIIKITYPDVPMKPAECESYVPMVPRSVLRKLLEGSWPAQY